MTSIRRNKWQTVAILAALAVGVAASCFFIGKMRERKPFVSKVTAEYRFRCTLSTDQNLIQHYSNASEETFTFSATPNPIREWIAVHVFHQAPSTGNVFNGRPQLMLGTETAGDTANLIKIVAGYPEPDAGAVGGMKTLTEKHFRLDDCPATVTKLEIPGPGKIGSATALLVCTPDFATYFFAISIAEPPYSDQADHEIQPVISSFHIEKVAASASGRR